jgi:hypothetical protein
MKRFLLILFIPVGCVGQNYQLWYTAQEKLFSTQAENPTAQFRGAKAESFEVASGDTIITLTKAIQTYNPSATSICFVPGRYGWAGEEVIIRPSTGEHWITTLYGDSVYIRAQDPVGSNWLSIDGSAFGPIHAEVVSVVDSAFFGVQDSVKTIKIGVYDVFENEWGYEFGTILLSEHYGLLSTLAFSLINANYLDDGLPVVNYFGEEPFYSQSGMGFSYQYYLSGSNELDEGITNLTDEEIYDFQPGDVLHIIEDYSDAGTARIREVLDRFDVDGVTTYIVDGADIYYSGQFGNPQIEGYVIYEDQEVSMDLFSTNYGNVDMKALPGTRAQPDLDIGGPTATSMIINDQGRRVKRTLDGSALYYLSFPQSPGDTCTYWAGGGGFCSDVSDVYSVEGLGGPYMNCSSFSITLIYYEKGEEVSGTPLDWMDWILSSTLKKENQPNLFPNPSKDFIHIEGAAGVHKVTITDLTGQVVGAFKEDQLQGRIDVKLFSSGVYLLSAFGENELLFREKLIIALD